MVTCSIPDSGKARPVKNIHRLVYLGDIVRLDMRVQQFFDFFLVLAVVDNLGISDLDGLFELLKFL